MGGIPSQYMSTGDVKLVVLGIAQDGGVPQAGCECERCADAMSDHSKILHPVSCMIRGSDGSVHLVEASRAIASQLGIASASLGIGKSATPDSVSLTHAHLGHIDGLGQFGKEVMGLKGVPLFASPSVIRAIDLRGFSGPFQANEVVAGVPFSPSEGCGFELEFIRVPHRDEYSDTHAIKIVGPAHSLLFLPDHDDWDGTLEMVGKRGIREWLSALEVDYALFDGTFWSGGELGGRDMSQIPHPTIMDTMSRLGRKKKEDPEIFFIHLNHTNPALVPDSEESKELGSAGWAVVEQGSVIVL